MRKYYKMEVLKSSSDNSFHFDDDYGYQDKEIEIHSLSVDSNENLLIKFNVISGEKNWNEVLITMINKDQVHSSTKRVVIDSFTECGKIFSNQSEEHKKWLGISMFLKEGEMVEIEVEFI